MRSIMSLLFMLCLFLWAGIATAQTVSPSPTPISVSPLGLSFTVDAGLTAPGTVEMEYGTTATRSSFTLPMILKWGSTASRGLFHNTEFSVSANAIANTDTGNKRITQFGNQLSVLMRRRVYQGKRFAFSLAPHASFYLRGDKGAVVGLTGIMAYSNGLNQFIANVNSNIATKPSPTNPRREVDLASDFVRTLGKKGWRSKVGVFGGVLYQSFPSQKDALSFGEGITYRIKPNMELDIATRQLNVNGQRDYAVLTDLIINFGRPHKER